MLIVGDDFIPFNSELNGKQNEYDFVKNINGKRIRDLSPMIQMFLYDYYGKITNYNEYVYAWMNSKKQKTDDIYSIILAKKDAYSSALHFGSLTYQVKNRCINRNPKYEGDRHIIQIKWYNISDDIIENMNNNVMKKMKSDSMSIRK